MLFYVDADNIVMSSSDNLSHCNGLNARVLCADVTSDELFKNFFMVCKAICLIDEDFLASESHIKLQTLVK